MWEPYMLALVGQPSLHGFYAWSDVTTRLPIFGIYHARKGVVALLRPTFEPLFMTHPSQVGSTTPRTFLAAMLLDL